MRKSPRERGFSWGGGSRSTGPCPNRVPFARSRLHRASLLRVSDRTIRRWIKAERIPFLRLPGGEYRIPQGALLASLRGTYDLAGELRQLEEKHNVARSLAQE
jgi:excisionase family DNA binding protein